MTDVTQILNEMEQGDAASAEKLLPLVYASSRQLLALSEALDQLEKEDRPKAVLVKLRYFAGMSLDEAEVP